MGHALTIYLDVRVVPKRVRAGDSRVHGGDDALEHAVGHVLPVDQRGHCHAERLVTHGLPAHVERQVPEPPRRVGDDLHVGGGLQPLPEPLLQAQGVEEEGDLAVLQRQDGRVLVQVNGVEDGIHIGSIGEGQLHRPGGAAVGLEMEAGARVVDDGPAALVEGGGLTRGVVGGVLVHLGVGTGLPLHEVVPANDGLVLGHHRKERASRVVGLQGCLEVRLPVGFLYDGAVQSAEVPLPQARLGGEHELHRVVIHLLHGHESVRGVAGPVAAQVLRPDGEENVVGEHYVIGGERGAVRPLYVLAEGHGGHPVAIVLLHELAGEVGRQPGEPGPSGGSRAVQGAVLTALDVGVPYRSIRADARPDVGGGDVLEDPHLEDLCRCPNTKQRNRRNKQTPFHPYPPQYPCQPIFSADVPETVRPRLPPPFTCLLTT